MKVELHDPTTWPMKLLLLVRKTGALFPDVGVLLPGAGPIVYEVNVMEATAYALARCERRHYLNFEEMASDGWAVD